MRLLLTIGLMTSCSWAQLVPTDFHLGKSLADSSASYMQDTTSYSGIASNSIVDVAGLGDSLLFLGTSRGLSMSPDLGATFRSYLAVEVGHPLGGISALLTQDSLVAIAAIADTNIDGDYLPMGKGLAYSLDEGDTWTYLDQPKESPTSPEFITFIWGGNTINQLAVTTVISNTTYDMALGEGNIWAASWAGGLRRYDLSAETWAVVPLPRDDDTTLSCADISKDYKLDPNDPNPLNPEKSGFHNHKGFSVMAYDSLVWVGTAAGLNKGIFDAATGCLTWSHYTAAWDGLTGDWVVALHRQQGTDLDWIWAATVNTSPTERRGLSYTDDEGETWRTTLLGKRVHNITSSPEAVYVAALEGVYKSLDGQSWVRFKSALDDLTGEQIWSDEAYGVYWDSRDSSLWISTPDGLARTRDEGITWEVERTFVSTANEGEERFYAYPNPFYPALHNITDGRGHVRFQYHVASGESGQARIDIFDFSMSAVASLESVTHGAPGDYNQVWDATTDAGNDVVNGVYYCRLSHNRKTYWTKLVVIK